MPNVLGRERRTGLGRSIGAQWVALRRLLATNPATFDPLHGDDRVDAAFESAWRSTVKRRALCALGLVALWAVALEARLVELQVFQHEYRLSEARAQQQSQLRPEALRGDIVDRDGHILAYSVEADAIVADPTLVEDPGATSAAICQALADCSGSDRRDLERKLSGSGRFVYLRRSRNVLPEQVTRVAALKLPGILLRSDPRRYYPYAELGAHVVGFVGQDNTGQGGIEYSYNDAIKGTDGLAYAQVDARRQRLETRVERAPVPGATVELTLNVTLQYAAERALREGVEANRARGGSAIVMDPYTGEVLALANYPTFNPNIASRYGDDQLRDRAIADVYEPGSTFKLVTASAALENHIVAPTDLIDTNPGYITIPGRSRPIFDTARHGVISFEDVIVESSNVGAVKVGLRTGAERMTRYVERFGFGQLIAPDLAGGTRGLWNASNLGEVGLASVSMGYQVSVTPLQMVTAASAVANGGTLMEPHFVRAVVRDGVREPVLPKALHRAIESETAATLTSMMEGVVERGTAPAAQIPDYGVAGKTGTARKIVGGRYSSTDYNASFVGFVPSRRPVFTILVVIDTPRGGTYYGGTVAAPIFKRIAEAALQDAGVPEAIDPPPPVRLSTEQARLPLQRVRTTALLPAVLPAGGPALMPDLRGLSGREALRVLTGVGLTPRMTGVGFVARQAPEPGRAVERGGWASVELQRAVMPSDDSGADQ
jgi:cell division protein FtsI (penicillin-binding protein 3)